MRCSRTPRPRAATRRVARWVEVGKSPAVITQNIDNLHQDAGLGRPTQVVEIHGNTTYATCLACGLRHELAWIRRASRPTASRRACRVLRRARSRRRRSPSASPCRRPRCARAMTLSQAVRPFCRNRLFARRSSGGWPAGDRQETGCEARHNQPGGDAARRSCRSRRARRNRRYSGSLGSNSNRIDRLCEFVTTLDAVAGAWMAEMVLSGCRDNGIVCDERFVRPLRCGR